MDSDAQNVDVGLVAVPETSNQPNVGMMDKCDRGFQLITSGGLSIKERFLWKQLICSVDLLSGNCFTFQRFPYIGQEQYLPKKDSIL
jgi:hypothetical protein